MNSYDRIVIGEVLDYLKLVVVDGNFGCVLDSFDSLLGSFLGWKLS